jgi:protein PhnA
MARMTTPAFAMRAACSALPAAASAEGHALVAFGGAAGQCIAIRNRLDLPMTAAPACPQCTLTNTYRDGDQFVCADCGFEWSASGEAPAVDDLVVRDSNGNRLVEGDTVVVIKDLKVKGSSIPLKQGTVIRQIRLVDGDAEHIEGHSDKIKGLVLKTCFLRKA